MDRRRFLNYAAAGVAVAGSALAGYELDRWQNSLIAQQITTTTLTDTETLTETTTETVRLSSLDGRLFFDYNGNGVQDKGEPAVAGASVQLKDNTGAIIAETLTDSSGDYRLEDIRTGSYKLSVEADKKFRYMCRSAEEFTAASEGYDMLVDRSLAVDIGLMEGFLTLPMSSKTHYEIDRFYDHDPDADKYLWWNGKSGYDKDSKRGYSPNHAGIDYYMNEGEPLLAQAPGIVEEIGEDERGKYIWIRHPYDFRTSSGHISKTLAQEDDFVSRGQPIAISGTSGNYPHNHQQLTTQESRHRLLLDPYAPEFEMKPQYSGYYDMAIPNSDVRFVFAWATAPLDSSNPNLINYWTKFNDPQSPAA